MRIIACKTMLQHFGAGKVLAMERLRCRRCFMLEDAAGIRRVVIACGYVDLRKGINGLSMIIGDR